MRGTSSPLSPDRRPPWPLIRCSSVRPRARIARWRRPTSRAPGPRRRWRSRTGSFLRGNAKTYSYFLALEIEIEVGQIHVRRTRDFDVAVGAEDNVDVMAEALDQARFVRGSDAVSLGAGEGFLQQFRGEHLRRLRQDDALAGNGGGDERDVFGQARALHFLDRVHSGDAEDGGLATPRFGDHPLDLFAGDKGPHGVVDENELG